MSHRIFVLHTDNTSQLIRVLHISAMNYTISVHHTVSMSHAFNVLHSSGMSQLIRVLHICAMNH